jgi:hypothetical protein
VSSETKIQDSQLMQAYRDVIQSIIGLMPLEDGLAQNLTEILLSKELNKGKNMTPRSIFNTGTVQSAFWGFGITAIALSAPYVTTIAQRYAPDKATKDTIADVAGLLTAILGAGGVVGGGLGVLVNRATIDPHDIIYGPSLVPGLNKTEAFDLANQVASQAERLPMVEEFIKGEVALTELPVVKNEIAQQVAAALPDMHNQVAAKAVQLQSERFLV